MSTTDTTPAVQYGQSKIDDILTAVGTDAKEALRAFKAEQEGKDRAGALTKLAEVIEAAQPVAGWAERHQVVDGKARFQVSSGNVELLQATPGYESVTDIFEGADTRTRGVRLDTADPTVLERVRDAFRVAARHVGTASEIRDMLALAKMADLQAETARSIVTEPEADTDPTDTDDVEESPEEA